MKTANQLLAEEIVKALVEKKLIAEKSSAKFITQLAEGTITSSTWKVEVKLALNEVNK